nr:hypothetical protein [Tanacetum cinerariifolium]
MIMAQQDDDIADDGAASVAVDDVHAAVDKPSIPSPPLTTQPPPSSQDLPFTSQDAKILMDLLHTLLETCTILTRRVEHLEKEKIAQTLEITKLKQWVKSSNYFYYFLKLSWFQFIIMHAQDLVKLELSCPAPNVQLSLSGLYMFPTKYGEDPLRFLHPVKVVVAVEVMVVE